MIKPVANKYSGFMYINPATPSRVISTKSGYFVFQYSFLRDKDEKCLGVFSQIFLRFGLYYIHIYLSIYTHIMLI